MRIITVEREYGSGGARIAEKIARRLGWKLWDTELTQEIARRAHVKPEAAARHDERIDPLLYRLFKVFARGSHERALPIAGELSFDTDRMVDLLRRVVEEVAATGNSVIVGRGLALYSAESPGCVSRVRVRAARGKNPPRPRARQKRGGSPRTGRAPSTRSAANSSSAISAPIGPAASSMT